MAKDIISFKSYDVDKDEIENCTLRSLENGWIELIIEEKPEYSLKLTDHGIVGILLQYIHTRNGKQGIQSFFNVLARLNDDNLIEKVRAASDKKSQKENNKKQQH